MNSLSPELALSRMSPELRPLLCTVVRNGRVGLDSTNCLRITDLKSGCTSLTPGPCCDRFKLHIPYAGETLKWDIIFNARDPELPPDFIFGEDAEFLPEPSELPHLVAWDADDPECLLQLVKELLQQYHQYQCQRLKDSSRLLFEYDSLLEDPNYGRSMEIYAGRKNSWTGEFSARFLLKLPVDFSNIPIYLLKLTGLDMFTFSSRLMTSRENAACHKCAASASPLVNIHRERKGQRDKDTMIANDTALDPGEDVALLSVSFEDAEATQVFPKLFLSPSIEQAALKAGAEHIARSQRASQPLWIRHKGRQSDALGGPSALHIPAFPSGGCLIDYVPQVCQLLTNKVQYVIQGYHRRREYIAAFLSHFGMGVVEYDAVGFTKLTLLLMWKDFCFLVHVDLPLYFPRDQPTLTFQSVYHFSSSGQLYSQVQKSYPYSPRWDGNEMAKRAKAYFKSFIPQFQEGAFANGKL
ncbi:BRISC and BRCA1-A complex member 2 [Silurus asotus]|uniref:BRISC and BRCA1-A complex member 2 n=1 Tax=Silurus asotus TaxID=30991 RepID=A0AAD5AN58_SILAS|nr:BRISC and BRCA1-A complex member 2 [Silurus asotus]